MKLMNWSTFFDSADFDQPWSAAFRSAAGSAASARKVANARNSDAAMSLRMCTSHGGDYRRMAATMAGGVQKRRQAKMLGVRAFAARSNAFHFLPVTANFKKRN